MARTPADPPDRSRAMGGFQRLLLVATLAVLVLSVAARAYFQTQAGQTPGEAVGNIGASFLSGEPAAGGGAPAGPDGAAAEPEGLERYLPLLTEGSFFALIGFGLGYASRKLVKVLLIFLAIFFIGLQGLVYAGVADVDWSKAVAVLNDWILNIRQDEPLTAFLKEKVPSAAALLGGYLVGFRRG
jgi:uncharacterized membrane protein (Fun14 family)